MEQKDWILLLVPTAVSIIGFLVTFFKMKKEYRNSLDEKIFIQKKETYIKLVKYFIKYKHIEVTELKYNEKELDDIFSEIAIFASRDITVTFSIMYSQILILNVENYTCKKYDGSLRKEKLEDIKKGKENIDELFLKLIVYIRRDLGIKKFKNNYFKRFIDSKAKRL